MKSNAGRDKPRRKSSCLWRRDRITKLVAHLGDILSEGFFLSPDYVEAYQWLILAARAEDRMSEVRLRRVKARLSAKELAQAEKDASSIEEALSAIESKRKSTEKK